MWLDREEFTDEQLRTELGQSALLTPGRSVALAVTEALIQLQFTAVLLRELGELPAKRGRLTFEARGAPSRRGCDHHEGEREIDIPIFSDVNFTYTMRERLSISAAGSTTALDVDASTDTDAGKPGWRRARRPGECTARPASPGRGWTCRSPAPQLEGGVGGGLAASWPAEILTRIAPPLFPGKVVLAWTEVEVDRAGVRTFGTFSQTRPPTQHQRERPGRGDDQGQLPVSARCDVPSESSGPAEPRHQLGVTGRGSERPGPARPRVCSSTRSLGQPTCASRPPTTTTCRPPTPWRSGSRSRTHPMAPAGSKGGRRPKSRAQI